MACHVCKTIIGHTAKCERWKQVRDEETRLAVELQDAINVLVKKYRSFDHLTSFTSSLEEISEEIDACMEDIEDVE